ncbi:hypothetical protein [Bacteroides sp. 224]|uniref:acyltransferase n=1 Tax=Bacteroides sp. 224 TaxID=2302936 RepID=UPI001940377F|nr:hypothetical protein [Bacteroides sp. 224]
MPILLSKKVYLRGFAGKIILDCNIIPGMIKIGFGNVGIFDEKKTRSIWDVRGTVIFRGKANIGHGTKISVGDKGVLVFGRNFMISAASSIICVSNIEFGNDCLLSWDILIMDTDFHKIINSNDQILNTPSSIVIGNHVWIGCRCLILKGTVIPNNVVIGANVVLTRKLSVENCVYAGNPVKCVKEDVSWEL